MLRFDRKQQNSVKQLSINKKNKFKRRERKKILNVQKTKIMTFGPVTSWQIDGDTMETARDFISLVSKFTAYGDCSHEIKRRLLLGRKAMINLVRILKAETSLY